MQFSGMRRGGGYETVEDDEQTLSVWPLGPRKGSKQHNHRDHKSLRGPL